MRRVLGDARWELLRACGQESIVNMTDLALRGSGLVNGVAMRHGGVSRGMFPVSDPLEHERGSRLDLGCSLVSEAV